jgi:glycosyltransferase involved in cell wall biosynthesis
MTPLLPKLGVLVQYCPIPLHVPDSYTKLPELKPEQALRISIITPSYNQAEFIERTIKSVLDQGYPRLEYIVQDGESTDGTKEVLRLYSQKLTHFESRKDNGQAHAINLGVQRANGEIMAYLNSDDILLPGTLWYVADYFIRHPDVDVIYSHRVIIDEKGEEIGRWVLPPHDDEVMRWVDYVPQETLFWRRSLWSKAGNRIDESYQFALDWELLTRFQAAGAKFVRVPRFLAAFRVHTFQKTSMQINQTGLIEMNRLRKEIHGRDVNQVEIKRKTNPYLRRSIIYQKLYHLGILRY